MANRTRYTGNLVSNSNLYVDPSTDRVGLGTTNPVSKLHVIGDVNVSGLVSSSNINTGIITATEYYGTFRGNISYASTAGIATNVIGGIGSISQLSVSGLSTFTNGPVLIGATSSTGTSSQILQVTGGSYVSGSVGIGTTNPTSRLHVVGDTFITGILTANRIFSNDVVGTALSISGISTLGTVQISSGIITATSGVVTYFGDGSKLSGISTAINLNSNTANQNQLLIYGVSTGSTTGLGVTNTLVYNPSLSRLGIGTTNPLATLHLIDDLLVSSGSTFGIARDIQLKAYSAESGSLSFEDVDNSGSFNQYFSITKDNTSALFAVNDASYNTQFIVGAGGSVGIGTTNPTSRLHVLGGDIRVGVNTSQGVILTSPNGTRYRLIVNDSGVLSTVSA